MAKKIRKFTKKDLMLIEDFINSINKNIKIKISENKRFECDIPNNIIYLGIKNNDKAATALFYKWFKQQKEYTKINKKIISILHEVGHFQTFNQALWEERNEQEEVLTRLYDLDLLTYEELNFAYWDMPNERLATMWAVWYYKSHKKQCDNLATLLKLPCV